MLKLVLNMIWGNHDMVYRNPDYVKKHLSTYFEPVTEKEVELFKDIQYNKAIILNHCETGQQIFLTHGHQADWWNYLFWGWSRFLVRILWKPLNVMGFADPTSLAKNYKELIKMELRTKKWISNNNNLITIVGHAHRPRFPEPGDTAFLMMVVVCIREVLQE